MNKLNLIERIKQLLVNTDSHVKLSVIGVIVGITSGFAALGLNYGLHTFSNFFISVENIWIELVLPSLGLIVTVILLKYIIKDFGGHGLPDVIHSISLKGGKIKFRSAFSKLLGSLITISTGGSAGPEAPIVVSGSAIGSNFAKLFRSDEKIKIAVTGSGAAAAIAAIFNAPITGIIFTMEVILGEWAPVYMLPVAIASVTGTALSRFFNGNQIPFVHRIFEVNTYDIVSAIGLAAFCAVFSVIFIKSMRNTSSLAERLFKNDLSKALVGGILVGIIIYFVPSVRGEGYKLVKELIAGEFSSGIHIVSIIILFKIVATSITLGSGGAGGVFAPGLVIGSLTGLLYHQILVSLSPDLPINGAELFALVGMAGVISGILQAPLTGMFLIIEITSGYDAILPLLIVSFLTPALVKLFEKYSIYHYELVKHGHLQRPRTDGKILADIKPIELLERNFICIKPGILIRDLIPIIKKSKRNYYPVVDEKTGEFYGMVYFNDIKEFVFNREISSAIIIDEIMHTELAYVSLENSLIEIQRKFDETNSWSLPVLEDGNFKGLISKSSILDLYRKELKVQTEN